MYFSSLLRAPRRSFTAAAILTAHTLVHPYQTFKQLAVPHVWTDENKSRPNIFVDIILENMFRFNVCNFPLVVEIPKICICVSEVKMGKPSGIRTARKHVKNRRNQVWADKDYKKAHLGTRWKANPFGGASHAKVLL